MPTSAIRLVHSFPAIETGDHAECRHWGMVNFGYAAVAVTDDAHGMYFERSVSEAVLPFQRTEVESDGKQVLGFDKQPIGASRFPMSILWRKGPKAPIYLVGMV